MIIKVFRTTLGLYSLFFTLYALITSLKNGFNPYLLLLFPLPLYFIIITIRQVRRLYHHPNHEFVIEGNTNIPAALNLRFLFRETSPSFLITVCLFSAAVGGTIIRAFTR
ncbi:MAG: hypothetical protein AAB548_00300 [Patescibacteria group bacterium]